MNFKRITTSLLLLSFMLLFVAPITGDVTASTNEENLYEFLKSTKDIKGSYTYPSMGKIVATNATNLKAHTPIIIRCDDSITTREIVNGSTVDFVVVADVKDSAGRILIKAGSPASAQISFSRARGRIGQSGELTVSDFHTTAVDGTYVPLSGSVSAKADDKMVLSICLSVFICPLFLLMHGEDAQVPAGTQKTVYTVIDHNIKTVKS